VHGCDVNELRNYLRPIYQNSKCLTPPRRMSALGT
jgi:hypothetical protein